MTKIKKAVIPAAGLGTRMLPISKSVPKEMLPIVDRIKQVVVIPAVRMEFGKICVKMRDHF